MSIPVDSPVQSRPESRSSGDTVGRGAAAVAGVAGAGLALGLAELAGGAVDGIPSVVDAVAAQVVAVLPGGLVTWAIETFGESDRLVIGVGIVIVVLSLGAVAGTMLRRGRGAEAATLFGGFALFGVVAAWADISTSIGQAAPAVLGAAAIGFVVSRALVGGRRAAGADVPTAGTTPMGAGSPEPADAGDGGSSDPTLDVTRSDGRTPIPLDRRRFLAAAGAVGGAAALAGVSGRVLGRPPAVNPAAADLADMLPDPVQALPPPPAAASLDVDGLTPLFVPNDDFYRIDTALTGPPQVDVATWRLRIHGQVRQELSLNFTDLVDRGLVEADITLSCVSNEVGGGLVGNARWTGVPLAPLLDEVGVLEGGTQLVGRAIDGFTVGFPTEVARDGRDAMIAVAMNGEPLPIAHGFPARLVVPGLYGYVSATKWLSDLELTGWDDFDAYWIQRTWSKEGPIKTQSRIDRPGNGSGVAAATTTVAGVAWAPTRGIRAVEIQVDDQPWQEAELSEPLNDDTWIQWRADVDLAPGDHDVRVRATDGTGTTQDEGPVPPHPDGAEGWHQVRVTAT